MISFADDFSEQKQKALKIALLSTIPGLGQLFNRRLDKALAFFLVNLANIAFLSCLAGAKLPFIDCNTLQFMHFMDNLQSWRPGTVPFLIIQLLLASYVFYSQFDAYKDALLAGGAEKKPELSLSHTTCGSYLLHMAGIFLISILILFKICPDFHPKEVNQITLSFELNEPEVQEEKAKGIDGQPGIESKILEEAHLRDPRKDDIQPSSQSKEMTRSEEMQKDTKIAAREREQIASKQIISPESSQSPEEVSSKGASTEAKQSTKIENQQDKLNEDDPAPTPTKTVAQVTETTKKPANQLEESVNNNSNQEVAKPRLIAELPPSAAAASGIAIKIDESNSRQSSIANASAASDPANRGSAIASATAMPSNALSFQSAPQITFYPPPQQGITRIGKYPHSFSRVANVSVSPATTQRAVGQYNDLPPRPYAGLTQPDLYSYNQNAAVQSAGSNSAEQSETGKQEGPSMLGFMDASLSDDAGMRAVWSEMSGNISRYIKANPLLGEGTTVTSFTLNSLGQPVAISSYPRNSQLSRSLQSVLKSMPQVQPPAEKLGSMYFQVKASNNSQGTFVSLELNSQPQAVSSESLSDFKYQTNLQAYLKGIKKEVYKAWKPPVQEGIKPVMVGFTVTTTGRISNQHIVQSSGDPKMDRAALNAALSVSEWSQPPAGTSEDMDVCMVLQKCKNCDGELKNSL